MSSQWSSSSWNATVLPRPPSPFFPIWRCHLITVLLKGHTCSCNFPHLQLQRKGDAWYCRAADQLGSSSGGQVALNLPVLCWWRLLVWSPAVWFLPAWHLDFGRWTSVKPDSSKTSGMEKLLLTCSHLLLFHFQGGSALQSKRCSFLSLGENPSF